MIYFSVTTMYLRALFVRVRVLCVVCRYLWSLGVGDWWRSMRATSMGWRGWRRASGVPSPCGTHTTRTTRRWHEATPSAAWAPFSHTPQTRVTPTPLRALHRVSPGKLPVYNSRRKPILNYDLIEWVMTLHDTRCVHWLASSIALIQQGRGK